METLGRNLMVGGAVLLVAGALIWFFGRGDGTALPGDIVVERKNVRIYFPVVTCLVLSVVLSAILWLFRR